MAEVALGAEGLTVGYGKNAVAAGISFSLGAGEMLLLIGPNGGGKSTLIKTLLGVLTPLAGTVCPAMDLKPAECARHLAYVPQVEDIPFDFTVREMVMMGRLAYAQGLVESAEDRQIVEGTMHLMQVSEYADRSVLELSGGERQRVVLARAMAQRTKVVLLDEPNAHLDVRHQAEMEHAVSALAANGVAVVAAIHDLNMALRWNARVLLIADGVGTLAGKIEDLHDGGQLERAYQSKFEFIEQRGRKWIVSA